MPEESYSFTQARTRLEEIVSQVRRKDVSLEKSLDLLEEGVRLANQCTELIDHADWEAAASPLAGEAGGADDAQEGVEGDGQPDSGESVPAENSESAEASDAADRLGEDAEA